MKRIGNQLGDANGDGDDEPREESLTGEGTSGESRQTWVLAAPLPNRELLAACDGYTQIAEGKRKYSPFIMFQVHHRYRQRLCHATSDQYQPESPSTRTAQNEDSSERTKT